MKKSFWLVLLLVLAIKAEAAGYKSVYVTLLDGSVSQIDLTDDMKTTFDETNVIFSDETFLMEFEKQQVSKFEFSELTGIESTTVFNTAPIIKAGILTLHGMPDNSRVAIYSTSGTCISENHFSHTCSINLNDLPSGVYIVNVNNISYKIAITK